jgi:hypothetical protein
MTTSSRRETPLLGLLQAYSTQGNTSTSVFRQNKLEIIRQALNLPEGATNFEVIESYKQARAQHLHLPAEIGDEELLCLESSNPEDCLHLTDLEGQTF